MALKPDFALAYYNRANAYDNKGLYDQAIADGTQSLAMNLNSANAYNLRGYSVIKKTTSLAEGKLVNSVRGESVADILVGAAPVAGEARIVLDTHSLSRTD